MFIYKIILLSILVLTSCSTTRPTGKDEAEILYKEASEYVENDRFIFAADKLREIKARFPYSNYSKLAQLKLADIAFEQENYIEAAAAYQGYKDLYPGNDKIPYVIFRLGESFFKQLPKTHDRDLEEAYQAIAYFKHVIKRYPKSEYYEKSIENKKLCEKMLQDKEVYIADFYYKTKVYEAARFRYKKIMQEFDDNELLQYAMIRVVKSSLQMKDKKTCTKDANIFIKVLNRNERQTKDTLSVLKSKCEVL